MEHVRPEMCAEVLEVVSGAEGVEVKAYLIDPESMAVVWMNEAANRGFAEAINRRLPAPLGQVLPVAEALGVRDALVAAATTGDAQHVQASLVSTNKGSMALVASVYRLPDAKLLVLVDQSWQTKHKGADSSAPRRPRHR